MKLLDKYNRTSLITTCLIIIVAGFVYYFTISYILTGKVDKDLMVEENEIFDYVKINGRLPQVFKSEDLKIKFRKIDNEKVIRKFSDTQYYNDVTREMESGRSLVSTVNVGKQHYMIIITESKVETEELIRVIFLITLGIILVLLVFLLLVNRVLMRNLWQPFYSMLQQIKQFNLADQQVIAPLNANIDEFNDMNREVTAMSKRVTHDYIALKKFVENAAHELMTPVAVLNSKLDNLAQDNNITVHQSELITELYGVIGKMTRLNKSMLLLARIENKLMSEQVEMEISEALREKLSEFQGLYQARGIVVDACLQPCHVNMNRDLLTNLFNNLLTNAMRHNHTGGKVIVELDTEQIVIGNTGDSTALDKELIFQRFYKSADSEGTGLGLTLVKEICDLYGFQLSYHYADQLHCFTIKFLS